jgi:SAM-dependent methyltransferase
MTLTNIIKSLGKVYNKSTIWFKILIFMILFLLLVLLFKGSKKREGFEQQDKFTVKTGNDIYDSFYANIYDHLVFNNLKDDYEIGQIINDTSPTSKSKILDIGSGTGHHVGLLQSKGFDVMGLDISPAMVEKAKINFPDSNFKVGNALNQSIVEPESFTHILCMYFTIYYFKDKEQFFQNAYRWLLPNGYLVVHLVDRDRFDPILPPGNPLLYVSPQRYAKERITSTKVKFTEFSYSADFKIDNSNDSVMFIEKFKNDNDGKVRKHEHQMYMPEIQEIVDEAQGCGFILESKIDLLQCQYEYQYLYIFRKPS